ncbi:ABC transporter permease [Jiella sp. M17.18]|uniref:ABC transporter permease n=1 Tax=Jiella sp. M17.18 TaxID=3234247 RepID=UPI0034DE5CFF
MVTTSTNRWRKIEGTAPWLLPLLLAFPVGVGLLGAALPAFGYMPALGGTTLSLAPWRALLAEPGLGVSIALGVAAGLVTTLLSVAGTALFLAAAYGTRFFRLGRHLLAPLIAVPHAAAAFGLALLIAPSGLLFRAAALLLGFDRPPDLLIVGDPLGLTMIAGLIVKEMPFLLLVALAALPQADPERRLQLARSLGYGRIAGFLLTVWPGVYRQIRLPVIAVAAFASSVVDVALILGPSTPAPLAVRLVAWMNDPDLTRRFEASAGALLQLGVTLAVILVWLGGERFAAIARQRMSEAGRRLARDAMARPVAALPAALAGLAVLGGLFILAAWSFAGFWAFLDLAPRAWTVGGWARVLGPAAGPLRTAFTVALAAACLALVLVVLMLEGRRTSAPGGDQSRLPAITTALLYLPLIVPQVAFVFGLQVLILAAGLTPSLPLLVAVHLIFVAPYVALALADPWFALDPRYERVASSLGRSRLAALWRVRLPMLAAPILSAFAIGFAVSVGQYLPTVLIGAGRLPTITTEAVALAAGGNRRVIGVYALLQTLLPFLAFALAAAVPRLLWRGRRGIRPA